VGRLLATVRILSLFGYNLFLFVFQGRSRSLTHLDCLDPSDLTSDVVMTTDTADRLIVPSTEHPRMRRQKLVRSQVTNKLYVTSFLVMTYPSVMVVDNTQTERFCLCPFAC
jgi:hypothetical protein